MEAHRYVDTDLACRHFAAIGMDSVFIGDAFPSETELQALSDIKNKMISLKVHLNTEDSLQKKLLGYRFTARYDEARDAVRAMEGEAYALKLGGAIMPENIQERLYGDITIDNVNCPGFMGELQIMKRPSPPSERTNVAARVNEDEQFLIDYIVPGKRFRFLFGLVAALITLP